MNIYFHELHLIMCKCHTLCLFTDPSPTNNARGTSDRCSNKNGFITNHTSSELQSPIYDYRSTKISIVAPVKSPFMPATGRFCCHTCFSSFPQYDGKEWFSTVHYKMFELNDSIHQHSKYVAHERQEEIICILVRVPFTRSVTRILPFRQFCKSFTSYLL